MLTVLIFIYASTFGLPDQGAEPAPAAAVQAVGIGLPPRQTPRPQGRLMAQRAAELVALRNLAIKLGVGPRGRLPTFRYISTKHLPNGSVEVTVETTVLVGRNRSATPTPKNGVRPRRPVGGRP